MKSLLPCVLALAALPARADDLAFRDAAAVVNPPGHYSVAAGAAGSSWETFLHVPLEVRAGVFPRVEVQVGADVLGAFWSLQGSSVIFGVDRTSPLIPDHVSVETNPTLHVQQSWLSRLHLGALVALVGEGPTRISGTAVFDFSASVLYVSRDGVGDVYPNTFALGLVLAHRTGPWLFEAKSLAVYHALVKDQVVPEGSLGATFTGWALAPGLAIEASTIPSESPPNAAVFINGSTTGVTNPNTIDQLLFAVPSLAAFLGPSIRLDAAVAVSPFGNRPWMVRTGLRFDGDVGG